MRNHDIDDSGPTERVRKLVVDLVHDLLCAATYICDIESQYGNSRSVRKYVRVELSSAANPEYEELFLGSLIFCFLTS